MNIDQRNMLIQKIAELPTQIRETVKGLTDDQLDTPYREGGWTVRQVVHHLADSHVNGYARFRHLITEDHPTLKPYDQDQWAKLPDYYDLPLEPSFAILSGLHQRWAYMLANLEQSVWGKSCYHPEDGELSLDDLLEAYSNHGEKHIGHINALKEKMNW